MISSSASSFTSAKPNDRSSSCPELPRSYHQSPSPHSWCVSSYSSKRDVSSVDGRTDDGRETETLNRLLAHCPMVLPFRPRVLSSCPVSLVDGITLPIDWKFNRIFVVKFHIFRTSPEQREILKSHLSKLHSGSFCISICSPNPSHHLPTSVLLLSYPSDSIIIALCPLSL